MRPFTARMVVCVSCGGRIPLATLQPSVVCPYCRTVQHIADAQRDALTRYHAQVHGELARAERERLQVRAWDRWYGGRGGQAKAGFGVAWVVFGGMLAFAIALGCVAQAMMMSGDARLAAVAVLVVPIGVPVIALTAIIGYSIWYYGGKRRKREASAPVSHVATCPNCGAANELEPGQVLERCAYCGTGLMPSPPMMAQALSDAEAARLRAELERYRAERRGMATAIRTSAGAFVPYIVLGSFLPMTLGGAIAFTADGISKDQFEPGLAALWSIAAVNGGSIALVYVWRRAWADRFGRLAQLANTGFAQQSLDFDGFIGWLNAHWAGPVPLTEIFSGAHFRAVSLAIGGYPGLLVVNPTPLAEGYPGYIAVYLAARIPGAHANRGWDPETTAPQRAVLEALGFRVSLESGGIKAHADARTARRLARRADGGGVLAEVATMLLGMARAKGAAAVELPPE
jgi:DNA-directed RNA polymerase subunit RPC12/RpoP